MSCEDCPCPGRCKQGAVFCKWAASGDEVLRRAVCAESRAQPQSEPFSIDRAVAIGLRAAAEQGPRPSRPCCGGNPYA